ncbi:transcriptional regulator, LysR family [Methyloglobulus morosus KoM1]|uniref:Transcriptional regulator, LysR family n=1 Tax=Methyloglobulus morosus KoM1 TaxID=1116472 RepID=V5BJ73_9GAMM|nr:LysR family transcriptional regulator [Methyloglobulus morosus]ESS67824.1 transcriptional regulator, LysR family [Methyloglobulus morosus KoM1]
MANLNWDDVKYFLALSRFGSVRAASEKLEVSHSTIARHVESLENYLGARLFDRSSIGYAITSVGEEVLGIAEQIEEDMLSLERRIVGQDQKLSGVIRVTMGDALSTHLLMPHFVEFCTIYPDITLEAVITYERLDIGRREADVALRFTKNPPDNLIGKRLVNIYHSIYASEEYLMKHDLENGSTARWISYVGDSGFPDWVKKTDYPHLPLQGIFKSMLLQLEATKAGMGICKLPCFLGDAEPALRRVPPGEASPAYDLWLLTHTDMRKTARIRIFSKFLTEAILSHRELIEGEKTQSF